ncbi:MAG: Maf family protein [Vulcanimicrobiaceae bacterium]
MRELTSVVLASASPRRYELLKALGLTIRVVPSAIDEGDLPGYGPRELAAFYAGAKADVVAARESAAVIVAADTVVDVDGVSFGKPADAADAAWMLRTLSGRRHLVHTAYVVVDTARHARIAATHSTRVSFAALSAGDIAAYVASGESMDKAGAYGIQGRGAALVERIDGDFYTVMGFPLGDFVRRLPDLDYRLAGPSA